MTLDSMEKMRLDRRMANRHGWWKQGEYDQELEALPDSAAKATTLGAIEDEAKPESAESEPTL